MSDRIEVLIIDDELQYSSSLSNSIQDALTANGRDGEFNIIKTMDMAAAISAIENGQFDVLITDKRIAASDNGLILARLVRASSNPNIPVIMMTRDIGAGAPATNPVIVAAKAAGVDVVIDKYNLDKRGAEFIAIIDSLLAEKAEIRKLG